MAPSIPEMSSASAEFLNQLLVASHCKDRKTLGQDLALPLLKHVTSALPTDLGLHFLSSDTNMMVQML